MLMQIMSARKEKKGDPFTHEDFTSEQLASLVGPQGAAGADGKTPQRVDYQIEEDKQEIVQLVLEALQQ